MSVGESLIEEVGLAEMVKLAVNMPPGAFAEVGVYRGGSAFRLYRIAQQQKRELHLFDTFAGIPWASPEDSHQVGDFKDVDMQSLMTAMPWAFFHVGIFPHTLPETLDELAFVHCDCDQYQSVRAVIDELWPRVVSGGIMMFDDMNTIGGRQAIRETFGDVIEESMGRYFVRKA